MWSPPRATPLLQMRMPMRGRLMMDPPDELHLYSRRDLTPIPGFQKLLPVSLILKHYLWLCKMKKLTILNIQSVP